MSRKPRVERLIVDNRVMLLGLDKLYRDAVRVHERKDLLKCARKVARKLGIVDGDVPVEGYYAEAPELVAYFQLISAIRETNRHHASTVSRMPEFRRLLEVCSSPIFGRPIQTDGLLPVGRDPLSQALRDTRPEWTIPRLTTAADRAARTTDDFSLVGLASLARDPVVLTVCRESMVLYAECMTLGETPDPHYAWKVDPEISRQAMRFVKAFNSLLGESLPLPDAAHAGRYWSAAEDTLVCGRCVRLGQDDARPPRGYYHWAVCMDDDGLTVQAFWASEVWTTERYRQALPDNGRRIDP